MTTQRLALAAILLGWALVPPAWGQETSVAEMRKRADEVLKMGNIEARVHIEDVMRLADRLAEDGNLVEAVRYYEAGLRHFPLDLKRQLGCAEVYVKMGKRGEAQTKARIVVKMAEEDSLVGPARKMLGEKADTEIEAIGKVDGNSPTIVLAPLDEIDVLLLRDVRDKLEQQLGITVLIRKVPFTMPAYGRDPLHEFAEVLRRQLKEAEEESPSDYADILKKAGMQKADMEQDDKVVRFFQWLVAQSKDPARKRSFAQALFDLNSTEKQWDSNDLLVGFKRASLPYWQGKVRFIGVTRRDIYSKDTAFLLANAYLGQVSVMSYRRFMSSFTNETVNRDRLLKRTVNQALSASGKVFGIDSCSDPTCPRAYPHSVAEHDTKSDKLCDKCRAAFDKAFGRK